MGIRKVGEPHVQIRGAFLDGPMGLSPFYGYMDRGCPTGAPNLGGDNQRCCQTPKFGHTCSAYDTLGVQKDRVTYQYPVGRKSAHGRSAYPRTDNDNHRLDNFGRTNRNGRST